MLRTVDDLMHGERRFAAGAGEVPWTAMALIVSGASFLYGAVMGSFGVRPLQMLYSGLKVPLLLGVSTLICLPSIFVLNTVMGLRRDLSAVMRGLLVSQGTVAVTLASLAPITAFMYLSTTGYELAKSLNALIFLVAALAGQITLARHYRPLIAADPRHRLELTAWLVLYLFVAIQMAWLLRPFIGAPDRPPEFLRDEPWDNAYVQLFRAVASALAGD
ncbi:MAG: hypothetical protein AB1486_26295 [Planctomycetota bacterium]